MKINDLQHIEVATQEIKGGRRRGSATANAGADALAIGRYTYTSTYTSVTAVKGFYSSSSSGSYASAS